MLHLEKLYSHFIQSNGVCIDSREIKEGQIFFSLKGEKFDGNKYALETIQKGAILAVVDDKNLLGKSDSILFVDNALTTLQELAKHHRNQLEIPVIGLTGSNGKTTTKELIYSVLKNKYFASVTKGNLNNHIGVPLTLLSIQKNHEIAVVEMGANHQKEIEFLSSICQPDIGYITNFGKAHLEGFGGVEGVIKGKSELYTYLRENNKIVLINLDDKIQVEKSIGIKKMITFSSNTSSADNFFSLEKEDNNFINVRFQDVLIQSHLMGEYNFPNICAAISLGKYLGLNNEQIKAGVESYIPNNNRSQIFVKNIGQKIILDAYNANPDSMSAAIHNLANLVGTKLAILGDMFELGNQADAEHQTIIKRLSRADSINAYFVGSSFYKLSNSNPKFKFFDNTESCLRYIKKNPPTQNNILIKGSRGMRLELLQTEICKE